MPNTIVIVDVRKELFTEEDNKNTTLFSGHYHPDVPPSNKTPYKLTLNQNAIKELRKTVTDLKKQHHDVTIFLRTDPESQKSVLLNIKNDLPEDLRAYLYDEGAVVAASKDQIRVRYGYNKNIKLDGINVIVFDHTKPTVTSIVQASSRPIFSPASLFVASASFLFFAHKMFATTSASRVENNNTLNTLTIK